MEDNQTENKNYVTPYNVDVFSEGQKLVAYTQKVSASPESIKNILINFSTAEFIQDTLRGSYDLSEEQGLNLTRIIRDVLLGDLFINDMAPNISQKLMLNQNQAQQITDQIINELFATAREDIKKIQMEKFPERVQQDSKAPQQSFSPKPPAGIEVNEHNIIDLRKQNQS